MQRRSYDTDLTDDQWELIKPYIFDAKWGGRPRSTDMREILNAIFYMLKNGCMWRGLPRDFPPWGTVYRYFRAFGVCRKFGMAFNDFYRQLRLMDGRSDEPSLLTIDSQSVKTAKMSNLSKGFDGGKKVKGRKRHLAVDGAGNIVGVVVTSANTHDVKGGKKLIRKLKKKHEVSAVQKVVADKGYRGEKLSKYVKKFLGGEVEIGENHTNPKDGFIPAQKRWLVERGFAWLGDYRRLDKDYEERADVSCHMIELAILRMALRRLCPVPRIGKSWV